MAADRTAFDHQTSGTRSKPDTTRHLHDQHRGAEHARVIAERFPELPYVDVVQTVIGPVDEKRVGVIKETRMRVNADGN